ncbi:Uncharacterized protein OS=Flavobacterium limnosediminis JC2902 GN=FLJC2902T_23640 PE=4 SV=1 [Gemmataceae bacterium]|jgi:hypothetical protein|nr:Uncharacterized protein OS=Flavobacterium limnosediminis JC2902 GN=FLJC2902T_23640 PE=4 SV=1 [Gemmataceae bacterium]VTU02496.1 Uncharacterized protein OS=Flavobacterium limnosediminis JC2902 GN=FLJC2902T_23640 PE=4 SV=1 [Gemmataceae bacterium]
MSRPDTHPVEGIDYYVENGRWVFTAAYHRKRGRCCENVCRHCPFGNSPADREQAANGSVTRTTRESK